MERLTFLELAREALELAEHPMSAEELWELARKHGLTDRLAPPKKESRKTPWDSLGSQLYVITKSQPTGEYVRVGKHPTRFWLRRRPIPAGWRYR